MSEPAESQPPTAVQTRQPDGAAEADEYVADGPLLYRRSGSEDVVVYSAELFFPTGWDCWVENPVFDDGVLYFTEGGMTGSDYESSAHRIIRIDGAGRTVLHTQSVIGYVQLAPYGDYIVFVQDGFDSQQIGWAYKDGSGSGWLDFTDYAAKKGVEPYYIYAELYFADGSLFADVGFFVLDVPADEEIADDTVWIKPDMTVETAGGLTG
jgi:hypothetical protein